jgi:hypothetical protein
VAAVNGAVNGVGVTPVETTTPQAAGAAPTSLLPEPQEPFSAGTADDAMSCLYTAISNQQQNQLLSGETEVHEDAALRQQALANQRAAIQREEADRPRSFWSGLEKVAIDVAKVAAIVGSVAVTAATAGAGSPLIVAAAIALSVGGAVVQQTQCFGKASTYVGLGLELGGAVTGFVGSLGVTGLSAGAQVLATAGRASLGLAGVADFASGTAHIVNAVADEHVELDAADATEAQDQADRASRLTDWVLSELETQQKSNQGALQTLQGAWQTNDETAVAVANSIRG